jgi:hypothetical protein
MHYEVITGLVSAAISGISFPGPSPGPSRLKENGKPATSGGIDYSSNQFNTKHRHHQKNPVHLLNYIQY